MPNESCDVVIFRIFLIFIKKQKKQLVIKELEKQKDKLGLKGSMKIFYTKFEPYVLPLGEFYITIMNKQLKHIKRFSQKHIKLSNSQSKSKTKTQTKNRSKSSSRKGGFLFMLTDKGKEPITGDDIKEVIKKYNKAFGLLYYTRYGQDSTVVKGADGEITANIAQPYTALQAILAASSKDLYGIATNRGMDIFSILQNTSELFNIREYYNLYKLYMREYYKSEALHDPVIRKKIELAKRMAKGPPKDPTGESSILSNLAIATGTDMESVLAGSDNNIGPKRDIFTGQEKSRGFVEFDRKIGNKNGESNAG
jgi:hypothetical protein